ncbi:hypothetical protein [Dipodfec virus UOA04_Rod_618]|nr:hypothetical protein [Dipodfec virus UOA04_Rod_618]
MAKKQDDLIVYSYRYMWTLKGSDNVQFRIITDTQKGHDSYIKDILALDNLEHASRIYLSECNVFKSFEIDTLKKEGEKNEA